MPAVVEALTQAWQFHRAGNLLRAEQLYRQFLQRNPAEAQVWYLLGAACHLQGKLAEAEADYRQALQLKPDYAEAHHNLGVVLATQRRVAEAEASFRRALRIKLDYAEALNGLGAALRAQGKLAESETHLRHALRLKPEFAEAHYNLGNTLHDLGRLQEAVASFEEAARLQPSDPKVHNNLAVVYKDLGRIDDAIASCERVLALKPDHARAHSNLLYLLHYHPHYGPAAIFAAHQDWARRHAEPLAPSTSPPIRDPNPERRLRIGYVSPDFRQHVVASFIEPILAAHDWQRFAITCYADVPRPDVVTERLQRYAEHWRSLVGIADGRAAQLIREDRIDILVDLAGHTGGSRLLVFARKPAPVQVGHFGYPDTTGLPAMDYRITDGRADPPGATERFYTEQLVRLPEVAWCYQPPEGLAVSDLPALQTGSLTFGCLNNPAKVTAEAVALWSRILAAVPGSRLWLLGSASQQGTERLQAEWTRHGIGPERVQFLAKRGRADYLRLYDAVDIGLDPFPYNGGVTTCDALWMGVPVVTLAGKTYVSRQGVSLLTHLGLPELIAETTEAYVEIAVGLARDRGRLRAMRAGLRGRMERSTLTNGERFTRQLETAYRQMWEAALAKGRTAAGMHADR